MKKIFTFLFLIVFALRVNAQLENPITFEVHEPADTSWTVFANGADGSDADVSIVPNAFKSPVNPSDSVCRFIVHDDALTYVGMYSDAIGEFGFTTDAHNLTLLVYKTVISPVTIKIELPTNGGSVLSVTHENTLTDEWELMTFDFSAAMNKFYKRLTIFPDFPASARESGTTVYIDNIANHDITAVKQLSGATLTIYPNPAKDKIFIQYPRMSGLKISNLLGKTIQAYKFETVNSKSIDIKDVIAGIYFISVKTASGTYTTKFIKQ